MGTADKVCAAALAMREQAERRGCARAGRVVHPARAGRRVHGGDRRRATAAIVDGAGGTSGPLGVRARGRARRRGRVSRRLRLEGSAVRRRRRDDRRRAGCVGRGARVAGARRAAASRWEAYLESAVKAVAALAVSAPARARGDPVRTAGARRRRARRVGATARRRDRRRVRSTCSTGFAAVAKQAAQGAALVADGLAGGASAALVDALGIREASRHGARSSVRDLSGGGAGAPRDRECAPTVSRCQQHVLHRAAFSHRAAAAESAARAGFAVTAIDAFGDLDQHPSVRGALAVGATSTRRQRARRGARRPERRVRRGRVPLQLRESSRRREHARRGTRAVGERARGAPPRARSDPARAGAPHARVVRRRRSSRARHPACSSESSSRRARPGRAEAHGAKLARRVRPEPRQTRLARQAARVRRRARRPAVAPRRAPAARLLPAGARRRHARLGRVRRRRRSRGAARRLAPAGRRPRVRGVGLPVLRQHSRARRATRSSRAIEALVDAARALASAVAEEFGLVGVNGIDFVARDGVAVRHRSQPALVGVDGAGRARLRSLGVRRARGRVRRRRAARVRSDAGAAPRPARSARRWSSRGATSWSATRRPWLARCRDVRDIPHPGERIRGRPAGLHGLRRRRATRPRAPPRWCGAPTRCTLSSPSGSNQLIAES